MKSKAFVGFSLVFYRFSLVSIGFCTANLTVETSTASCWSKWGYMLYRFFENQQKPTKNRKTRKHWEKHAKTLRSGCNSRELNSPYFFLFFGHSSEYSGAFLAKIGRNSSYRPPGPFSTLQDLKKNTKTKILERQFQKNPKTIHDY